VGGTAACRQSEHPGHHGTGRVVVATIMGADGHDPEALTRYPLAPIVTGYADLLTHPPGR
jgi:hypothetical protein